MSYQQTHYAMAGQGKPVLFLHHTPRFWDEYREAPPVVGQKYWAIAMDTVGFSDSYKTFRKERLFIQVIVLDFLDRDVP